MSTGARTKPSGTPARRSDAEKAEARAAAMQRGREYFESIRDEEDKHFHEVLKVPGLTDEEIDETRKEYLDSLLTFYQQKELDLLDAAYKDPGDSGGGTVAQGQDAGYSVKRSGSSWEERIRQQQEQMLESVRRSATPGSNRAPSTSPSGPSWQERVRQQQQGVLDSMKRDDVSGSPSTSPTLDKSMRWRPGTSATPRVPPTIPEMQRSTSPMVNRDTRARSGSAAGAGPIPIRPPTTPASRRSQEDVRGQSPLQTLAPRRSSLSTPASPIPMAQRATTPQPPTAPRPWDREIARPPSTNSGWAPIKRPEIHSNGGLLRVTSPVTVSPQAKTAPQRPPMLTTNPSWERWLPGSSPEDQKVRVSPTRPKLQKKVSFAHIEGASSISSDPTRVASPRPEVGNGGRGAIPVGNAGGGPAKIFLSGSGSSKFASESEVVEALKKEGELIRRDNETRRANNEKWRAECEKWRSQIWGREDAIKKREEDLARRAKDLEKREEALRRAQLVAMTS